MQDQKAAALAAMKEWLADPRELGKAPEKLEPAGEFTRGGLRYYIFKYKKSLLGKWLVGVAGGYEGETATQDCGHTYSRMQPYSAVTAQADCEEMVDYVAGRIQKQAERDAARERGEGGAGPFTGFVLLASSEWDMAGFKARMQEQWGIDCREEAEGGSAKAEQDGSALVFDVDGMMAAVSLMPAPVPGGEAERCARLNFMAREQATTAAQSHKAHLVVAVIGMGQPARKQGELYVKLAAACLAAPNALGIYANGTVQPPKVYLAAADDLKQGALPLLALVFVGLARSEGGVCGWTNGLNAFGRDELEIRDSKQPPSEVFNILLNTAGYVIDQDVQLRDGETLGYTAEQKLPITRSPGLSVEGMSLKIGF